MASQINYGIPNIPVFNYEKYMAKYEKENIEQISWILKLNERK